jgi:hypothetical protein
MVQSIDTVRCLEEKVLRAPIDADVGAILGWGYPPFRGGPLGWLHTIGLVRALRHRSCCWTWPNGARTSSRSDRHRLLSRMAAVCSPAAFFLAADCGAGTPGNNPRFSRWHSQYAPFCPCNLAVRRVYCALEVNARQAALTGHRSSKAREATSCQKNDWRLK